MTNLEIKYIMLLNKLKRRTFYGIKIAENQRTTITLGRFY